MKTFYLQAFAAIPGRKATGWVALGNPENPYEAPAEGAFRKLANLSEISMSPSGDNQDITTLGEDWIPRIAGLKDCSTSASGYFDPTDPAQLLVIRSFMEDIPVWVRYYIQDGVGFQQSSWVSTPMEPSSAADGTTETSLEFDGNGELQFVGIDYSTVENNA